jgi:hypothetical protein
MAADIAHTNTMNRRSIGAALLLVTAIAGCERPRPAPSDTEANARCYQLSTGDASRWRPSWLLKEPAKGSHANFWLATDADGPTAEPTGWVKMYRDRAPTLGQARRWSARPSGEIEIEYYDVDWGYEMMLREVSTDSVRGTVRFSTDELAPPNRARLAGRRVACPVN